MIRLGDYNRMTVTKSVDFGLYLDGGDEGEILLPARYVPKGAKPGDELEVFIYLDQDERPVATTQRPLARVGDFAYLEVAWVNEYGAFLNWGLMKDLFCPFREQKMRMQQGQRYIVYVTIDEESYRLIATAKVERYLYSENSESSKNSEPSESSEPSEPSEKKRPLPPLRRYKHGDAADLLVWQKTDLGFKVIVDGCYQGLIYDNQIFRPLHTGDRLRGYIDHVRQDGKIDLTLQPTGRRQTEEFSEVLLRYLHDNNGHCELGDKSPSELISDRFKVSKKTYKKAIGDLYRRHLIVIGDDGIRLV
ncbi:MAG: GntR family transcriptional regulator [Prevotella sp.]|nr:GntR family transcriptional regulator [Prevotella sp.]